ncbi:MAG: hypothetical protein WD873_06030 [Candidatus Hydrogenedentales bacterium]
MIIFTDVNIRKRLGPLVALLDADIREVIELQDHRDHFRHNTPDEEWLSALGNWETQPHILSYDGRILRTPALLEILRKVNLSFVYLRGYANLPWNRQVQNLAEVWPRLIRTLWRSEKAMVFEVNQRGKITALGHTATFRL